jgi:catechol 2,3-dioxygenase-like lactoylglutathione lyase family enzyme
MTRLSHLFVHVTDLVRSRRFYVEQLGLSVLMEHEGYLRLGGGDGFHMGIEERAADEVGAAGIEIVLRVDDVDTVYARLAGEVAFDSAPTDMPWDARHAWLREPDGYRISIYS